MVSREDGRERIQREEARTMRVSEKRELGWKNATEESRRKREWILL